MINKDTDKLKSLKAESPCEVTRELLVDVLDSYLHLNGNSD